MSSLLAAALVGALAVASAVGGPPLAAGVLIVQAVFTMGVVRLAPVPASGRSAWLALLVGAVVVGWIAWDGTPELSPLAKVLGPAFVVAVLVQMSRQDGRNRLNASLSLAVAACVLTALPAAWVGLRFADGGAYAVGFGLLGVGVAVLAEALGAAVVRRLLAVLVAGVVAAGLVVALGDMAAEVPAVSAVVIAAFGALLAVAALVAVDRINVDPVRTNGQPLAVGGSELTAERAVAASQVPLRLTLPIIAAAPVVYVLGRILVG